MGGVEGLGLVSPKPTPFAALDAPGCRALRGYSLQAGASDKASHSRLATVVQRTLGRGAGGLGTGILLAPLCSYLWLYSCSVLFPRNNSPHHDCI